jgi:hypothetical protein
MELMLDLIFIVLTVLFFAASVAFANLCERV